MPHKKNLSEAELRWKCRRGMLELDLLLNRFLDQLAEQPDRRDEALLLRLLEYPDQILYELLLQGHQAADEETRRLIGRIRQVASSRC